jgi:hypothetical protein
MISNVPQTTNIFTVGVSLRWTWSASAKQARIVRAPIVFF